MNILIDINHPGQVHLFMPLARRTIEHGGNVLFTARDKDVTLHLLETSGLPYVVCSKRGKGTLVLVRELFCKTRRILDEAGKFCPDAIVSLGSPPAAWAAARLHVPHIALEDTEHSTEQALLYLPFTRFVLTSTAFRRNLGKKQIRYRGYHELAYLHPKYFTPDPAIIAAMGLSPDRPYSVARFVSWQASHDIGRHGLGADQQRELIETLAASGPVVLTSEAPLPAELQKRCLIPPPEHIHHFLAFARLYVGEGATMASEAAMLGTPAVYTNPLSAGTLEEQERYGLLFRVTDFFQIKELCRRLTAEDKAAYADLRDAMLSNMDDLTDLLWKTICRCVKD